MLTSYKNFMDYFGYILISRSVAAKACRTRSLVYKANNESQIQRERGVASLCDLILHPQTFRLYWNIIEGVGVRKGGNGWGVTILGGEVMGKRAQKTHSHTHTHAHTKECGAQHHQHRLLLLPTTHTHTHHNNINLSPISCLSLSLCCSP